MGKNKYSTTLGKTANIEIIYKKCDKNMMKIWCRCNDKRGCVNLD